MIPRAIECGGSVLINASRRPPENGVLQDFPALLDVRPRHNHIDRKSGQQQHGIIRSKTRALLNVSIIKKEPGTLGRSVSGSVSASAINLTGQLKNITVREIREEDSIYYIGEAITANEETLIFTIDVTPLNESSRFSIRYMKQFFAD